VQVDLVIALMLTNGSDKSEVIDFVKNLASDDFIEKLKHKN
jgi:PTS system nitrogen regulatory IIA component